MAKKSGKSTPPQKKKNYTLLALFLVLVGLIAGGGMLGGAGIGGIIIEHASYSVFGAGEILVPIILITVGILLLLKRSIALSTRQAISLSVGLLTLLALAADMNPAYGGVVGTAFLTPFVALFDTFFGTLILLFICFGSLVIFFDRTPVVFPHLLRAWDWLRSKRAKSDDENDYNELSTGDISPESLPLSMAGAKDARTDSGKDAAESKGSPAPLPEEEFDVARRRKHNFGTYTPPPLSLLESDRGKANVGDVKANANIIRRTLSNFGIEVEMDEVTIGPTVTRYALKPAEGVKLSRIVGLQSDLALALAAHPIRIEAPIPGKSLVGIEIPNKTKATVGLANLLSDNGFQTNPQPLLAALGRNIAGKPVFSSIAKMPHLLIAGTTGSGKSVTIHAIISSLIYRHGPDDLRFIFVDPKRVELTLYNSIPHLLTPVITDAKKAILSLKWAATEMNRRYDILESESVRDIDSYHKKHASDFGKGDASDIDRMPYIVVVIDELADIMQAYPRELEAAIVRLAQMSRAVGIHLILSTQRPEVNVITGLIKANVPSRIALRVPTGIDSRTILDTTGAEKLLGQGDMLAMVGNNQPERLQSAFITEDEVKSVVAFLKNAYKDDIRDSIELSGSVSEGKTVFDSDSDADDDLYEDARMAVMEAGKGSTSYIQRKLKVGYARAARLMDMLEERGVIGPADGAKPREILISPLSNAASDEPMPPSAVQ